MTVRPRRPRFGIRARLEHLVDTDERQQATVTIAFIVTIAAVILILVGAVGYGWYKDNLEPVGKVGNADIPPSLLKADIAFQTWRISRDEDRITQANVAQQIDNDTASTKTTDLETQASDLSTSAVDGLVDEMYQSQLAQGQGIGVSDADIDARYQQEVSDAEQRHVLVIAVAPTAADATNGPTYGERSAALDKITQALTAVTAGQDWATAAKQFGTDTISQQGGDMGTIPQLSISDTEFGTEVFALANNGITGVIRGDDGTYRIGKVTDIQPGALNSSLESGLLQAVSKDQVRQLLGYEIADERLTDKIVADALAGTPDQAKLAVIYVDGLSSGDTSAAEANGEVDYAEIVFAPNDNLDTAPDLDPNDPAWATAQTQAQAAADQLNAITDVTQRTTQFQTMATSTSDDPTSQSAGEVGYVTQDIPPQAVADALWGGTHTKGDIIGPIHGDAGYYVLMFENKRASVDARVQAVKDALAQPGADFNAVAKQLSEGPEKDEGGEIGWFAQDELSSDIADPVWALQIGGVSDPLELGNGQYFIKVEDKQARAYDPDQISTLRQTAFSDWYSPQKDAAVANGTIVSPNASSSANDLTGGGDQGTPLP